MTEFVQHSSGIVHPVIPADERDAWWAQRRPLVERLFEAPDEAINVLGRELRLVPLRCGQVAQPGSGVLQPGQIGFVYVEMFDDAQLCTLCLRTIPAERLAEVLARTVPIDLDEVLGG